MKINYLAVLITSFNRKEKTLKCLKLLFLNELPANYEIEVFLVDDGSSDGTAKAVKKSYPLVNIIKGNGSLYWNRGTYLAWETASKKEDFDFYVWLNDDVELFPNSLIDLITASREKGEAIVTGVMKSKKSNVITYGGRDRKGNLIVPNGKIQKSYLFNGNFVCVPKRVFAEVGNLDNTFIHSIGDFDYGLRALKKGFYSYISPNYLGLCDKHEKPPLWCQLGVPFILRLKNLYSPLGNSHPYYYMRYLLRHFGVLIALKNLITIHLRLLIPKLWLKKK